MKAKTLLLVVALACVPAHNSFGQIDCTTSTKLVCAYPVSGALLSRYTFGNIPSAQAAYQAALDAAVPINAAIAAQLTQLPVPSATVGVISLKKKGSEVPVPFDNLGPILTDRPDTVGKGHLFLGFNYQHFNFNKLDGFELGTLPIAYTFSTSPGTTPTVFFYGESKNNVKFQLDQYASIATVGVSRTTDVSIIVPVNSISISVVSSNFHAYEYDLSHNQYSDHTLPGSVTSTNTGSSSGLGDITIGLKQLLLGQERNRPAAAIGATFRFPSGDSLNYLGSGTLGGSLYGLVEYRARFAPHFKVAYQWNGTSKVLNFQQSAGSRLPGGLQYAVGTDFRVHRKLTLSADLLGNQIVNSPYFTQATNAFNPIPPAATGIPTTYHVVSTPVRTYTTAHFSGGIKWSPVAHMLLYGNALVQVNDVGLKSDVVPLVGIAYNLHKGSK